MKILYVVKKISIGGTEAVVRDLASQAQENGHQPTILSFIKSSNHIMDVIKAENIPVICFPSSNPFAIRNFMFLLQTLKHGAYDIIHAHSEEAQFCLSFLSLFGAIPSPLIMTEHYFHYKNVRFNPIRRLMYQRYKKIICVSTEIKDFLNHHIRPLHRKCVVISNGVNLNTHRHLSASSNQPLRIVCTARLVKQKDLATAIIALTYCRTPFHLTILGDGKLRQSLTQFISHLNLNQQVSLLGWSSDIATQLQSADIYIQSSIWEGCSIAILEAMATGLPLIVSDARGNTELVGDAGLIFPIGNAKALAHHLDSLAQNLALRDTLSKQSLARAQKFSLNTTWRKHAKLYSDVLTEFHRTQTC